MCFFTFSMANCSRSIFNSRQIFFPGLEMDSSAACSDLEPRDTWHRGGDFTIWWVKIGKCFRCNNQGKWLHKMVRERIAQDPKPTNLLQGMNREPPFDPCWQVGLHSLAWPLLFKTTLASGVPSKHSLSARCWCTDHPWWACNQHSLWRALRSHWSRRQIQVQTTNRHVNYSSRLSRNQTSLLGLRSLSRGSRRCCTDTAERTQASE